MSILDQICVAKAKHVAAQKHQITISDLEGFALNAAKPRGFIEALRNADDHALIAEVKKASPSRGTIREDFDAVDIAHTYARAGATCLSVLTDVPYFQGSDHYFRDVRTAINLPMLRKDFMIDPYQIVESRALGADCILLIMACLSDVQASELYHLSTKLGMDTLFEVHDKEELDRTLALAPKMIGVNNRNLKTLEVDLKTSLELAPEIPDNILKVAESGISNYKDLTALEGVGFQAFLIGESLMRENNIEQAVLTLLGKNQE